MSELGYTFSCVVAHISRLVLRLANPRPVAVMLVPAGAELGVRVREGMTVKAGQVTVRL